MQRSDSSEPRPCIRRRLLAGVAVSLCLLAATAPAGELPRVVSTNLCADGLALALAAPEQLLSVSAKSRDPRYSAQAEQARRYPANHAQAEEIIALRPDIVLASRRWQLHNQAALFRGYDIAVVTVPYPTTWADILDSTQALATRLGRPETGAAIVADVRQRLSRLQRKARPLAALYLRANGGSAGRDTYVDTVFQAVGLRNAYAEQGRRGWGHYDLESLVSRPPDVFVVADMPGDQAYAKSAFARHPRLQALMATRPVLQLPGNQWGCSDWRLIESAETLARQLQAQVP